MFQLRFHKSCFCITNIFLYKHKKYLKTIIFSNTAIIKLILILIFGFSFLLILGSIYEPLKCINLPKPEGETLWDKLNHYYRIGKLMMLELTWMQVRIDICILNIGATLFLIRDSFLNSAGILEGAKRRAELHFLLKIKMSVETAVQL